MGGGAFAAAVEVHLVEVSVPLRRLQWERLRCEGDHPPPRFDPAAGRGTAMHKWRIVRLGFAFR